jgi:hypothetical protein
MRRSKRSKHKPAFMFDAAAGSHLARPYWLAVLVAQAILPYFHVCSQVILLKTPVETTQDQDFVGGEGISGSSAFEFLPQNPATHRQTNVRSTSSST